VEKVPIPGDGGVLQATGDIAEWGEDMEDHWDEYEADTSVDELWTELDAIRSAVPSHRPIVRKSLARGSRSQSVWSSSW